SGYLRPLLPAHAPEHGELLEDIPSGDAPSLLPPPVRPPSRPCPCALPLSPAHAPSLSPPPVRPPSRPRPCVPPSSLKAPLLVSSHPPLFPPFLSSLPFLSTLSSPSLYLPLHHTDISSAILPGLTHWPSPRFFAFFSSPTSAATICADALISALNVVGFSEHGRGLIHGTTSEALLVTLLAAKRRVLDRVVGQGGSVAAATAAGRAGSDEEYRSTDDGVGAQEERRITRSIGVTQEEERPAVESGKGSTTGALLVWVCGARLLPSSYRAVQRTHQRSAWCHVAGMPEGNVHVLPTTAALAYALTALQLLDAVQRDEAADLIPFFLVSTVSVSLKLWMVLLTYGAEGIRVYIRRHVALAEWFEEAVQQDERFQLMAPRPFALVCFCLKPPAARTHSGVACTGVGKGRVGDKGSVGEGSADVGREVNAAPLEAINSSGQAHLTHTVSAELLAAWPLAAWLLHSSTVSHTHTDS
ncbi:unnamed protein product, partial [Closterium sp. Naga37s-1]